MIQYKTICLPSTVLTAKGKEMFSQEVANSVAAPIAAAVNEQGKSGWELLSCTVVPAAVIRKKGFFEKILGWIPIIGLLFRSNQPDMIESNYYSLIFKKTV